MSISLKVKLAAMLAAGSLALFATGARAVQVLGYSQTASTNTVIATQNGGATATSLSAVDIPIVLGNYLGGGAPINATLNLTANSTDAATNVLGAVIRQGYTGSFCITSGASCTGTNYLSGTFVGNLFGIDGGSQFVLGASTPPGTDVTFTSSILAPGQLAEVRAIALSFTNVLPTISTCGTTICSFTASQSGTMSANDGSAPPLLAVDKTPDNGTFAQGGQVSFTIVVTNPAATGAGSATNVMLTDQLPGNGGLVWQNVTTSQGSCTTPIVGNQLSCALGTIPPQGSVTVTVTSGPTTPAAACQTQPNPVALATADGGLTAQDSGSLTCTPTPPAPQLSVVKTPDNGTFAQGAQVSFTFIVGNPAPAGSQSAINVMLTDQLPGNGGLVWQNVTTSQGSCTTPIVGNQLSCALGTIPPQGSVTVTVTSGPTTPAAACQTQPNPVALATADGGLTAQDSGSLTCSPSNPPAPQLRVVKTPDGGAFSPGSQVGFTIVVSNPAPTGAQSASSVVLTDQLPGNGGLVWISVSTTQGTCSPIVGNLLNCSLGAIPPQGSVTVTVASGPTTPAGACLDQPNPVAMATASGGLSAQDSGSLRCGTTPPGEAIPGPGIIGTALVFLAGALLFGGWRRRR